MVAGTLVNLGNLHEHTGRPERALEIYEEALPVLEQTQGAQHVNVIGTHVNIGNVYRSLGEPDRALEHYQQALRLLERTQGNAFLHAIALANMSALAFEREDLAQAEQHALRGLELAEATTGLRHPLAAALQASLAQVRSAQGKHDEALHLHRAALEVRRELLGPRHPETATSLVLLGETLVEASKPADAVAPLEEATSILASDDAAPDADDRAQTLQHARFWLARAWWDAGIDRRKARATMEAARDALRELPGDHGEVLDEIERWLAEHGRSRPRGR
jgi:tetratricopeptide (TPR) repeat protein